jgi:thioredoxin-like negative regulator of GroEL
MRKAILTILALAFVTTWFACGSNKTEKGVTLKESMAVADREGKPLLMDFYAEWCGPCKRFTAASHEDADLMKALGGVILHKIDCEKGEGIELAKKYEIRGYPTFILANSKGEPISRWMGYSKENFLETLARATGDQTTIETKMTRFKENPTLEDALALADYSYSKDDYKGAVEYFTKAQELDPSHDFSYDIFLNTLRGAYNDDYTYDDVVKAADKILKDGSIDDQVHVNGALAELAEHFDHPDDMTMYLENAISLVDKTDNPDIKEYAKTLHVKHSLYVKADTTEAIQYQKSTYGDNWQNDPSQLNSFAWWCYEEGINLEEAEKDAKKAVELEQPGSSRAMILDTVAHICKARGNIADAIKYMEMAVKDDPNNDTWKQTLKEFQEEQQDQPIS